MTKAAAKSADAADTKVLIVLGYDKIRNHGRSVFGH
jgi:hypothetical protein